MIEPVENSDGYLSFKLNKNGKSKTVKVHQIVAQMFVDKPDDFENGKYEVNHKDCNRRNNIFTNLEYLTHKDNIDYAVKAGGYSNRDFYGNKNPNYRNHKLREIYRNNPQLAKEKLSRPEAQNGRSQKIDLYDFDMNYISTFDWIGGCAKYLIENNIVKSNNIGAIRDRITKSIRNNKPYVNHYFKKA